VEKPSRVNMSFVMLTGLQLVMERGWGLSQSDRTGRIQSRIALRERSMSRKNILCTQETCTKKSQRQWTQIMSPIWPIQLIVIWLSFMLEYFSQNGNRIPTIPSMGNDAHRWVLNCHLDRHINLTQMVALHNGPKDAKGINTLAKDTVQ